MSYTRTTPLSSIFIGKSLQINNRTIVAQFPGRCNWDMNKHTGKRNVDDRMRNKSDIRDSLEWFLSIIDDFIKKNEKR